MTRYFGTDGVRGVAGTELTYRMAYTLGQAAVELLGPTMIIGRDTRTSGPMLEDALVAGITAAGGKAQTAGIIPTPAIALLARQLNANGGIVISASHNPPQYNGIKFFDAQGFKLAAELEDAFDQKLHNIDPQTPTAPAEASTATPILDANERYITHATRTLTANGLDLTGLHVAVDCAHGAAHTTTPEALRRLGAQVTAINTSFNGTDINVDCGSTHLDPLRRLVASTNAHIGIAHDGDADRVLAIDATGNEVDGDAIEAICATDLKSRSQLPHNTVVSTVMANLGFSKAMQTAGINVETTQVGDSNVLARMRAGGYTLGGEQSGHMIFLEHNTTGDGLITALQLLAVMQRTGRSLAELASVIHKYPQVLINVKDVDKTVLASSAAVKAAIQSAEAELSARGGGRILVRPSGTEPLIRVMVEAATTEQAQQTATHLAQTIKTAQP